MDDRKKFAEYLVNNEENTIHFMNDFLKKIMSKIFHNKDQSLDEFMELWDKIDGLVGKQFILSKNHLYEYERKVNENNKL